MPIDPADAHVIAQLTPWLTKCRDRINSRVHDARSHAENALTSAIINAAEGRQTWRMIKSQRSSKAASDRLGELKSWLAGSSIASISGAVQDARADFYRKAFSYWRTMLQPELLGDAKPTPSGEIQARGLILFALSPRQELDPVFLTAQNGLRTAINASGSPNLTASQRHSTLDTWEIQTVTSIYGAVEGLLSNSQRGIETLVGQEMIKPELRGSK